MKRIYLLLIAFSILCSPVYAQSTKTITLKDGSVLKGTLVELKDNVYTIQTSHLGQVQINESDILSINSGDAPVAASQNFTLPTSSNSQLTAKMQQMQQNIMSNPEMMQQIMQLVGDEEIQNLLKDPQLSQDIMHMDPEQIQNNEKVKALMENPKFRAVTEKIKQSFSPSPSSSPQ